MINLLKYQFRSVFKQKSIWISLMIGIAMLLLAIISIYSREIVRIDLANCFTVNLVEIVIICIIMSLDYTHNTTKNIISKGFTRVKLLCSKYITVVVAVIFGGVIKFLISFVYYKSIDIPMTGLWQQVGSGVICCLAAVFVYATISSIVEKTSFSIIACLVVQLIISTVLGFLNGFMGIDIMKYWISGMFSLEIGKQIVVSLVYITLSAMIGYFIVNKKSIK